MKNNGKNIYRKTQNSGDRMTQELAIKPSAVPADHEMMVYHTMAEQAVASKMYRGIGEKAGIMMIMLSARELGISPMQALNGGLNIIQGKVEISARMMNALIRRAGHQISVKESSPTECILIGKRGDTGEIQSTSFSIAEAQLAGLVKPGGGWTKWPKDMLFARALSRLARQLFSDVIGIGYVEGEIRAVECEVVPTVEEIVEEPVELVESDNSKLTGKYLYIFDSNEANDAIRYLKAVQEHFEWSEGQTLNELLKDEKRTYKRFLAWKEKNQPGEGN